LKKFQLNLDVLLNQEEFGTNCAVDKHTKISKKYLWKFVYLLKFESSILAG